MSASVSKYCILSFRRNSYLCIDGSDESGHVRWEPFHKAKAKSKKKWFTSKPEAVWFFNEHLIKYNSRYAIMSEAYYDRVHKSMKRMKITSYRMIDSVRPDYLENKWSWTKADDQEPAILWEKEGSVGNTLNIAPDLLDSRDFVYVVNQ